jgi:hypothetical protein
MYLMVQPMARYVCILTEEYLIFAKGNKDVYKMGIWFCWVLLWWNNVMSMRNQDEGKLLPAVYYQATLLLELE